MTKLETSKWAFLRVAVSVFDAYAHGATVPALARETALLIDKALRDTVDKSEHRPELDLLLSRAGAELVNMANQHPFVIREADRIRDHILVEMERLSR